MIVRIHLIKFKVVIKSKKGTHLSAFSFIQKQFKLHYNYILILNEVNIIIIFVVLNPVMYDIGIKYSLHTGNGLNYIQIRHFQEIGIISILSI